MINKVISLKIFAILIFLVCSFTENKDQDSLDWQLEIRQNLEKQNIITLDGVVLHFNNIKKTGCLFTIAEMVESGVARSLNSMTSKGCYSEEYGFGAHLYFGKIPTTASYPKPVNGKLMSYKGYWKKESESHIFYVTKIEPYF